MSSGQPRSGRRLGRVRVLEYSTGRYLLPVRYLTLPVQVGTAVRVLLPKINQSVLQTGRAQHAGLKKETCVEGKEERGVDVAVREFGVFV